MRRHFDRTLKLAHLRTIEALARHGSLLKAAGPLGVTQPALSRTLHEVETLVGQPLFERIPRGMKPTPAGLLVSATAGRVLADLHRLEESLDQLVDGTAGTVAIGALPVAAAGVLPGALQRLRALSPGIKPRLEQGRTEQLLPLLAAGAIDLVIGRLYEPSIPDAFRREVLWEEPITVLARAGHPILDGRAVTVEVLRKCELMLPTIGQRLGQDIEHALDLLQLAPVTTLRSSSPDLIRELLHSTDMLAVMPRLMMAGDLLRGTLQVVPLPLQTPRRPAGLTLPRDRLLPPAAAVFVAALRDYLDTVAAAGFRPTAGGEGA